MERIKNKNSVENIVASIINIYQILLKQKDLSPKNNVINDNLTTLVGLIFKEYKENNITNKNRLNSILNDKRIQSIRSNLKKITSKAEGEMERFWCEKFLEKDFLTFNSLKEFWYYENYETLTNKEISLFQNLEKNNENLLKSYPKDKEKAEIIFIGSGGLPLTAFIIAKKCNVAIHLLDIDQDAVDKSQKLANKLDLPIKAILGDATDFDYTKYKIAFVASLIPQKEQCFEKLMRDKVHFISTRGADGIFQILYDDIDAIKLQNILTNKSIKKRKNYHKHYPSDESNTNSPYIFSTSYAKLNPSIITDIGQKTVKYSVVRQTLPLPCKKQNGNKNLENYWQSRCYKPIIKNLTMITYPLILN